MKSAYELAMERLAKGQPINTLTDDQKKQLAEIDSQFKARIAEKELFLKGEIVKAQSAGKLEEIEGIEKQLRTEIRRLQEDCETKKEKLRAGMSWKFDTLRGKSLYEKGLTVKALGKRISISRDIDARKIEWSLPIRSRTKFKLRNLLLTGRTTLTVTLIRSETTGGSCGMCFSSARIS